MKVEDVLAGARDSLTVRRVYAEPIERDGTTVIPAAAISGGGGGGSGADENGKEGFGGGFGMGGKPVGAYVIKEGTVRWQPAVDVNRLMLIVGVVALGVLSIAARLIRAKSQR